MQLLPTAVISGLAALYVLVLGTNACTIGGTVDVAAEGKWAATAVVVALYRLNGTQPLSDAALFGGLVPTHRARILASRGCTVGGAARVCFDFSFDDCAPDADFAVVAASDPLGDSQPHPELYAPIGHCRSGASWEYGFVRCSSAVPTARCDITADAASPWPAVPAAVPHGKLWDEGPVHVLHTWGTARERGVAHGMLLGAQVVDFFRFFVLQRGGAVSAVQYETVLLPYLRTSMRVPAPMQEEIDGIIDGARSVGVSLHVPELARELTAWDIVATNAYLELGFLASRSASSRFGCSQVAFWGSWTVPSGVVAARNMDGEIDPHKVTALYTLVHAMETPGLRHVVSVMWPGFVGTLSGMSEDGRYLMMDSSSLAQNASRVDGATVLTWALIEALRTMPAEAAKTPEATQAWLLKNHGTSAGGLALAGSLLLFASNTTTPFVYENNRFDGVLRRADAVAPFEPDCIAISNHFLLYGAADDSHTNFGQQVSFSSLWRYETWRHKIEAWRERGMVITQNSMQELLQDTCHGTTEHAIIWTPSSISVAVAKATFAPWNAPYGTWTTMSFDGLFAK